MEYRCIFPADLSLRILTTIMRHFFPNHVSISIDVRLGEILMVSMSHLLILTIKITPSNECVPSKRPRDSIFQGWGGKKKSRSMAGSGS